MSVSAIELLKAAEAYVKADPASAERETIESEIRPLRDALIDIATAYGEQTRGVVRMGRDEFIEKMARAMAGVDDSPLGSYWYRLANQAVGVIPVDMLEEAREKAEAGHVSLAPSWDCSCGQHNKDTLSISYDHCPNCGASRTGPIQATEEKLEGFLKLSHIKHDGG